MKKLSTKLQSHLTQNDTAVRSWLQLATFAGAYELRPSKSPFTVLVGAPWESFQVASHTINSINSVHKCDRQTDMIACV